MKPLAMWREIEMTPELARSCAVVDQAVRDFLFIPGLAARFDEALYWDDPIIEALNRVYGGNPGLSRLPKDIAAIQFRTLKRNE